MLTQSTWSVWTAERSSSPANCRNHKPASTSPSPTHEQANGCLRDAKKKLQGRGHRRKLEGTEEKYLERVHGPRVTNHGPRLLNAEHPDNPHDIRRRHVVQWPLVFLLKLLAQILRGDVARLAIRQITA